jgi:hypothetical protein
MKRSSKMEHDLEVEFLQLYRALSYWICCFNVKAYFENHFSIRKTDWYAKLSKVQYFLNEDMHLIGATMFFTTLIDSALDHPCQHVPHTTDTRELLQVSTYGKQDSKDWLLKYVMKPDIALSKAKEKLSAIANKEVTLEDQMFQLSEFFLIKKICLLDGYY